MSVKVGAAAEIEFFKEQLLDITGERKLNNLLKLVVDRLESRTHIALARIWLKYPGDICSRCRFLKDCPDQTTCLHLVASAGRSTVNPEEIWSRVDGNFRRFPLGVRKVGQIGATGEKLVVTDISKDNKWIADREWAAREDIVGFLGQPISYQGEILGVLGLFMRIQVPKDAAFWLRMTADHVAAAIANTRAFEEIERLQAQLELENTYLKEEVMEARAFGEIVGQSQSLQTILRQIEVVAPTDASVLILGESGTGKELVAREIHKRSRRNPRQMIRVNCASIPKELYESEFFGHVRGAFTGAVKDRVGRFAAADGGTLFLDEVGEIPLDLQGKLLRVLQEGTYERVGEERTRKVDVRIVAATNRDLAKEVEDGRFRQDLFYRLDVFPIKVPPLRERQEDIPLLASHFLTSIAKKLNCGKVRLTTAHLNVLQNYHWPGNARELQNVMERAVITANCGRLHFDLPSAGTIKPASPSVNKAETGQQHKEVFSEAEMRRRERDNILNALEQTKWRVYGTGGAAELLGLKPTTLLSRIQKFGLEKPR